MKKILSLFVLSLFLISIVPFFVSADHTPTCYTRQHGDLNGDGTLSEADIRLLNEEILSGTPDLGTCGDMNNDNIINVIDLQLLGQKVLGTSVESYPQGD